MSMSSHVHYLLESDFPVHIRHKSENSSYYYVMIMSGMLSPRFT